MASNGDTIEIVGEGTLEVDDGDPEDVSGGGSYTHRNASGVVLDVGSITAKKLKSFESFGGSFATPSTWRLGRAQIRIRMVSEFDGATAKALLTVGCILPSPIERIPPRRQHDRHRWVQRKKFGRQFQTGHFRHLDSSF